MSYINENLNPKKRKVGDCSTRAIAKATGLSYTEVLKEQCEVAIETAYGITDKEVIGKILEKRGFNYVSVKVLKGSKRTVVSELAAVTGKSGKYESVVCRVANHVVACRDGNFYDIWNCGDKSVYGYWAK